MKTLDLKVFYAVGAVVFAIQACCSVVIFFSNPQSLWSTISVWVGILFNLLVAWLFLSLRSSDSGFSSGQGSVAEDDVKKLLSDLKKQASGVFEDGKKR